MKRPAKPPNYDAFLADVVGLLENARRAAARSVTSVLTLTYFEIGRRIFEPELSADLSKRFGRGFSRSDVFQMRQFYLAYQQNSRQCLENLGGQQFIQTASGQFDGGPFALSWSHYARLLSVADAGARQFYEEEALRGGWSVRQLDRQISTLFCDRSRRSKKALAPTSESDDRLTPDEEIRDPFVLEFLGLRDEYSESDLEDALIRHLEQFLLELGNEFAFVARQRRLRVGHEWYRVDLLFFPPPIAVPDS